MRYLIILIFLAEIPGSLFAQKSKDCIKISSLAEAWDYTLKNNQDLRGYVFEEEIALREVKIAKSAKRPNISGSFNGQKNISLATTPLPGEIFGQPGQTVDAQFGQEYNYNAGITISKNILNREASMQTKIAEENVGLTQLQGKVYEQTLKQQVAYYYYSYMINLEAMDNYQESASIADSLQKITQQKLNQGLIDGLSYHQAVINQNMVQQNIYNTQLLLDLCEQQLKTYLGLKAEDKIVIQATSFQTQLNDFDLSLGIDESIMLSQKQVELARLQVKSTQSAKLPNITLNNYWGQQQFRDDFGLSFQGDAWSAYNYLSINIQIPIFTGFANKNKIKNAKTDLLIAEEDFKNTQRKSMINDELLIKNHINYSNISKNALAIKDLFSKKYKLSDQKFQEGIINTEAHLKAFEDYLNAEEAYLKSLANLYTNYSNIISRK